MSVKTLILGLVVCVACFCLISSIAAADENKLIITYCDGSRQEVPLNQSKAQISSLTFSCQGDETVFGGNTYTEGALKGNIYHLPPNTRALPDFSTLLPVGSIYAKELNIPTQDFMQGFPGVTDRFEWFGVQYAGQFEVEQDGIYVFRLNSDDGSCLYIDNLLLINNDGIHPARSNSGNIPLKRGPHQIRVDYFQGPRAKIALQLFITPPGGSEQILRFGR